jgi:hypothetical protein
MRLMQAVPDDTMMVAGYEHQTWQCSSCNDIERRLAFIRAKTSIENVPLPSVSPQEPQDERAPAPAPASSANPSAWARTIARLRGKHVD